MSYDYTASVQAFAEARRAADAAADASSRLTHLQRAVTLMESLSDKCPLTPLLWMQYAATIADYYCQITTNAAATAAAAAAAAANDGSNTPDSVARQQQQQQIELELQTLQLGLTEFPASALLQLRTAMVQLQMNENVDSVPDKIMRIRSAVQAVGLGSHRNEEFAVVALYRIWAALAASQAAVAAASSSDPTQSQEWEQAVAQIFVQRSRVPMKDANQGLMAELQQLIETYQLSPLVMENAAAAMEEGRRFEAKFYSRFATYEDAVEVALHRDGVLARVQPEFRRSTDRADGRSGSNPIEALCWEHVDWEVVLRSGDQTYGMGLGSAETAKSFVQYARALKQFKLVSDDDDDKNLDEHAEVESLTQSLALAVYERGVAECPCIEYLWLAYIRDLQQWAQLGREPAAARLQQVAARAVRNCPYSAALLQQKLVSVLLLASSTTTSHRTVVDPDQLLELVQEGLDLRFLPNSPAVALDLFLVAIRIVKRRILILLAERAPPSNKTNTRRPPKTVYYDDGEPIPNNSNNQNGKATSRARQVHDDNDDAIHEVQDLLEDIGDMYDEVESRLRKAAASWTEGRALLWKERAQTESLLLNPLRNVLGEDPTRRQGGDVMDQLQSLEKCIRAHNPPHPDSYAVYIRQYVAAIATVPVDSAEEVLFRIRRVRGLFEKAIGAVGKGTTPKLLDVTATAQPSSLFFRDYETSLVSLCNEWLDFERIFGSERSLGKASKAVEKKLQKAARFSRVPSQHVAQPEEKPQPVQETPELASATVESTKRKNQVEDDEAEVDANVSPNRPTKKAKTDARIAAEPMETEPVETDVQAECSASKTPDSSKSAPKVRVGNMDYPAHPFTVRVSNLSLDTEDMDLVDTFRPRCGAIVHAKIIRDKHLQEHGKGKSKGWGLIQFERSESVETALALDDTLGIHDKLVKVDRSHLPAVSLVPPGMHRVRPKGEGKASKRNEKRRSERNMGDGATTGADRADEPSQSGDIATTAPITETEGSDVIAMPPQEAPRTVNSYTNALAFRPRAVGRGTHQKTRLKLDGGSDSKKAAGK